MIPGIRHQLAAVTAFEAMQVVNALRLVIEAMPEGYQQARAKTAAYELAFALMMIDLQQINKLDTEHGERLISKWEQGLSTEHALKG